MGFVDSSKEVHKFKCAYIANEKRKITIDVILQTFIKMKISLKKVHSKKP